MRLIDEGRVDAVELDLKDESGTSASTRRSRSRAGSGAVQDIYDLPKARRHAPPQRRPWWSAGSSPSATRCTPPRPGSAAGSRRSIQTPDGRPVLGLRRLHELRRARPCASTTSTSRARRRRPASTTSSTTTSAGPDGPIARWSSPASKRDAGARRSRPSSARRAAALKPYGMFLGASRLRRSPRRGRPRSRRHPGHRRATSTTSRRWSTRRTGGTASTTSPTRTPSRTRSSCARWRTSTSRPRAPARASCRGSRTSRSASTYGPAEVRRADPGARDDGIDEWLLWDPLVTYTADGAADGAARPAKGEQPPTRRHEPSGAAKPPAATPRRGAALARRTSSARCRCSCTTRSAPTAAATTT